MSFEITDDANFLGGIDFSDLTRIGKFNNAVVVTNEISPNSVQEFTADERDSFVKQVQLTEKDSNLPGVARLISIKLNVRGFSTESSFKVHQASQRREIDRVISIRNESVDSTPNSFLIGGGIGTPYINKDNENQIYFTVEEESGNTAEYDIEFNWLNVRR
jgi:hypothetical protein